jgi:hypothetical protein
MYSYLRTYIYIYMQRQWRIWSYEVAVREFQDLSIPISFDDLIRFEVKNDCKT